jgi:monoamine oxidase
MPTGSDAIAIDVAIVGGGVAGCYCAWRLQQNGRRPFLFEMSSRIGGRLWSVVPPNAPHLVGELGGMRFLSVQQLITSLVKYLGLATAPFPMGGPHNLATLRRRVLTDVDFSDPSKVPYLLSPAEQGLSPGQLLVKAIKTVIPNADKLTPLQWEKVKLQTMWNGDHLYNWGLWNLLMSINSQTNEPVLSSEAYALLYDGGGYESLVDNWNCAEAFEYLLIDFPSDAQYFKLVQGYQSLPLTLYDKFVSGGGTAKLNNRLVGIEFQEGGGAITLYVDDSNGSMPPIAYLAKSTILALPQSELQRLFERSAATNSIPYGRTRKALMASVMPMPAQKTLLAYPNPWWQTTLGLTSGRSTTDLPIRQVYYFGSENPPNTNSLLLASYCDGRSESFWKALWHDGTPTAGAKRHSPEVHRLVRQGVAPAPPPGAIAMLQQLLAQMHGMTVEAIPAPYFSAHMDWTIEPYGGGWHFWQPGIQVYSTISQIRQPWPDTPLYICGESFSNEQGWVEGALTSAEHIMQDKFGLKWPSWLPSSYYLGP